MATTPTARQERKQRKGRVISASMQKTVVVMVESRRRDPTYGKVLRHMKKLYVHDEKGEARVGDTVQVMETRPLSRLKRWRLVSVLQKAVPGTEG